MLLRYPSSESFKKAVPASHLAHVQNGMNRRPDRLNEFVLGYVLHLESDLPIHTGGIRDFAEAETDDIPPCAGN